MDRFLTVAFLRLRCTLVFALEQLDIQRLPLGLRLESLQSLGPRRRVSAVLDCAVVVQKEAVRLWFSSEIAVGQTRDSTTKRLDLFLDLVIVEEQRVGRCSAVFAHLLKRTPVLARTPQDARERSFEHDFEVVLARGQANGFGLLQVLDESVGVVDYSGAAPSRRHDCPLGFVI